MVLLKVKGSIGLAAHPLMLLALGGVAPCTLGQSVPAPSPRAQEQYAWTYQVWDSSDPYARVRANADVALARESRPDQLVGRYSQQASKQPRDPQALYLYAYTFYCRSVQTQKRDERRFTDLSRLFASTPSPRSYQYARLRFVIEGHVFATPKLASLGKRLLRRNPNDVDVNFYIINMLNMAQPSERALAFTCAYRLARINPKRASSYSSLGWVHFRSWMLTKNPQDADKAIAAYTKYLQLAPANDPFRPRAQQIIALIRKRKA